MASLRDETMIERGSVYGDFTKGLETETKIVLALLQFHSDTHGTPMPQLAQQFIQKIVMKLTRVAVSPDHVDSWHDISCYAQLIEESIKGESHTRKAAEPTEATGFDWKSQGPIFNCDSNGRSILGLRMCDAKVPQHGTGGDSSASSSSGTQTVESSVRQEPS